MIQELSILHNRRNGHKEERKENCSTAPNANDPSAFIRLLL